MNSMQVILCVDDEAIILMALQQELFTILGDSFRYECALNAEKALEKFEQFAIDGVIPALVISDWLMPGMDGGKLLDIVHERYPNAKSILITGHADDNALRRILADRKNIGVLRKPWGFGQLKELIVEALNTQQS
jgi:DNA-binding NtrC family response regulator